VLDEEEDSTIDCAMITDPGRALSAE
jgi:hypothetical protein